MTSWCALTAAAAIVVGAGRPAPESPYVKPELRALMDAVTFHVSFDADSLTPDMAEGPDWRARVFGAGRQRGERPEFADGVIGRALVLGTGGANYVRPGNVLLGQRGALAVWVKPVDWRRPNGENVVFVSCGGLFIIERQGPLLGKDNKVRRHEHVFLLAKPTRAHKRFANVYAGEPQWPNGKWRLLVANWSWPRIELSIDGGPFNAKSLPGAPDEKAFGAFSVGTGHGDRTLLDEVFAFRRPLTREEARLLYALGRPAPRAR